MSIRRNAVDRGPLRTTDATATPDPAPVVPAEPISDPWEEVRQEEREYLLGPRDWPPPCPWCGGRLRHSPQCVALAWIPRLEFGKHKGKLLTEVPRDYLHWMLGTISRLDPELKAAIRRHLGLAPAQPAVNESEVEE